MTTSARRERRGATSRRSMLTALGGGGLAALAGCAASRRVFGGAGGGTVTIEYVEPSGARTRETFQPVVDALNDEYDGSIELEFTEIPYENLRSQLQTRVGGGNAPDLAAIDQIWLGEFVDGGALLALDEVADDVDLDDFLDPFVETARFDDHHYAFPTTTDVRGMYWDKQAFADAGLDPESPPETWTELLDVAEALHDPPERYGTTYYVVGGRWIVNLFAAGGRVLSEDGTEPRFHELPGVAAAELVDDIHNVRDVGPADPMYRDGAGIAREFLQGGYSVNVIEGSWLDYFWRNLGNENDEMVERFGFAPTPHPEGGEPATVSGGHMWAAFEGTDHPDVVRDFLRIATGPEFMRHLSIEAGEIPTRTSLQDDSAVWDAILYADEVRDLLDRTRLRPVRNWTVVADALDPALQRVAFGRETPKAAFETAAERVRSELE